MVRENSLQSFKNTLTIYLLKKQVILLIIMVMLILVCIYVHHEILIYCSVIQDKLFSRICGRINYYNVILENIVARFFYTFNQSNNMNS